MILRYFTYLLDPLFVMEIEEQVLDHVKRRGGARQEGCRVNVARVRYTGEQSKPLSGQSQSRGSRY